MMRTGYISFPVSDNMGCDVCLILLPKDTGVSSITSDALPSANRFRIQEDSQVLRITPCGSVHLKDIQTLYCQDMYNSMNFTLNNNNKIQMALLLNLLYQKKNFSQPSFVFRMFYPSCFGFLISTG